MKTRTAIIAFDALSHPLRLKVFRRLLKKGDERLAAVAICEKMEIAPATLSFHMSKLINCELVNIHKDGRWVSYSVNYVQFRHLITFFIEKADPELLNITELLKMDESDS